MKRACFFSVFNVRRVVKFFYMQGLGAIVISVLAFSLDNGK